MSRDTCHERQYGQNPYAGYDDIDKSPLLMDESDLDGRLRPMEKIIGVEINKDRKAYPYSITKEANVINDVVGNQPVVIFHAEGAASALDASLIQASREDGSTGAFSRVTNGQELSFRVENGFIVDEETGSRWNIAGHVHAGDYFAFAWLVFFRKQKFMKSKKSATLEIW